ncbi:hypothetical protein [Kitasatospora aureofaciens]|uniref:hypothetical protein n=1 Tax=Kitasatospora aureofaciens TaxID=1894 RepID=UPI003F4B7DF4
MEVVVHRLQFEYRRPRTLPREAVGLVSLDAALVRAQRAALRPVFVPGGRVCLVVVAVVAVGPEAGDPGVQAGRTPTPRGGHCTSLATRSDRPADWLRAGQALQHALLIITLHGLYASMLHQATEPGTRAAEPRIQRPVNRPGSPDD